MTEKIIRVYLLGIIFEEQLYIVVLVQRNLKYLGRFVKEGGKTL
jgi:hypothetical protein